METKFTKGNWTSGSLGTVWCEPIQRKESIVKPKDILIASVYPNEEEKLLERIANEKLIAAAPELLEAVQALLTMMDRGAQPQKLDEALTWKQNDELARSKALSAIKKATE